MAILTIAGGLVAAFLIPARPEALLYARRMSVLRTTTATVSGLIVFATAVIVHILNPLFEGVPFVVGPLAATAAGLGVFAAMPTPTIDGAVRRRGADLEQRRLNSYSSAGQRRMFVALFSVTVAVVLASGLTSKAGPDGRSLCTSLFPVECIGGGPYLYPGWLFAAPTLILIAALLATIVPALRRIITAPAAAWSELVDADTAIRVAAVRLVLRIASTPMVLTLGVFLGAAGLPLLNAEVLETGLNPNGEAIAHTFGIILVGTSAPVIACGLVLAFLSIVGATRLPRAAADSSRKSTGV
ncbi:hypothetical protein [Cryobacterium sp. SO1]|uniref:hypothetical protein n=1 Tax=Cryobacterium sp. SO1 TaxID=1897061 RepID=UPI001023171A|nr:hypothetical protein [Cryobacterium sp. SO1]